MRFRSLTLVTLAVGLTAGNAFADRQPNFGNVAPKKNTLPKPSVVTPPRTQVGGETFATAVDIVSVPFSDAGNTCGFADDVYPSCAFLGISTAPDAVYKFTPTADVCVNVNLCNSGYDTAIHVYDSAFNMIDCNDDFCGLQSAVENVALTGGSTYYFVVDGYDTSCGDYVIDITACPAPCSSACPPGAIAEGEPECGPEYVDVTNGGCNSSPPVFTDLECNELGVTVCGTYGTYPFQGNDYRDTDWYRFTIDTVKNVTYCVCGSQASLIAIVNEDPTCASIVTQCVETGAAGQEVCCTATLAPGTYWLFVATDDFFGVPCGSPYVLNLQGLTCPVVNVQPTSWSHMKAIYR